MGFAERANKNSEWYKKHHPEIVAKKIIHIDDKPKKRTFIQKMKDFFCIPQ